MSAFFHSGLGQVRKTDFGPTSTFKMAADLMCHFFKNAVTPEIMVGIALSYLVHRGDLVRPFDFSTIDLGVTSRDLSMTLTVFFLRKWTLAPKLLGLEWCNLGKSYNKGLYSGFFYF